ncbi:MAG TPA: transposase, partial [Nitrososphaera sp.]
SLSKVKGGGIRIVLHRKEPLNTKQVTICRKNSKWYAIIACEVVRRTFSPTIRYRKEPVGIAAGITKFCPDSCGRAQDKSHQLMTKMLNPLKRAHRRVLRRQLGSSNYKKAKHMLAKLYERIHNKRKDFLHKKSTYSASGYYPIISVERLQAADLTKRHRSGHKISDASRSTFRSALWYKPNHIAEGERTYTSTDCSKRGYRPVPKSFAVRIHVCVKCRSAVLDRDYNASLCILQRSIESLTTLLLLPVERREVTPVEIAVQRSVKQEESYVSGHG